MRTCLRHRRWPDTTRGWVARRLVVVAVAALSFAAPSAQAAGRGASTQTPGRGRSAPAPARGRAVGAAPQVEAANLAQLMRGIVYPSSNVVFAAQEDLGKYPPDRDPATSPNPLTSTYGGWQA